MNDKVYTIGQSQIDQHCKISNKRMICNSLVQLENATECIEYLTLYKSDEKCYYKSIEKKNYLIQISENSLYFSIVEPTSFKLSCDGMTEILHISPNKFKNK